MVVVSVVIVIVVVDLIAIASEDNRDHASLWVIIDNFTEVNTTTDLVSRVTLRTERTTMSVGLEQSIHTYIKLYYNNSLYQLLKAIKLMTSIITLKLKKESNKS